MTAGLGAESVVRAGAGHVAVTPADLAAFEQRVLDGLVQSRSVRAVTAFGAITSTDYDQLDPDQRMSNSSKRWAMVHEAR